VFVCCVILLFITNLVLTGTFPFQPIVFVLFAESFGPYLEVIVMERGDIRGIVLVKENS
jgi:hypothetical protein